MAKTLVRNRRDDGVTLPEPYRKVLGPGEGVILEEAEATVLANLGTGLSATLEIRAVPNANNASPGLSSAAIQANKAGQFPVGAGSNARTVIYVRLIGDDTGGDGSLALPFRTIERALRAVPIDIPQLDRFIIDLTGMGTIDVAGGIEIPAYRGSGDLFLNFTPDVPGGLLESGLVIQAQLVVNTTILAANITSRIAHPTSGLFTVTTTDTLVPGALVGKRVVDSSGFSTGNVVHKNTANTLVLTGFATSGDLTIYDAGVTIRNSDAASQAAAVNARGVTTIVTLLGITLTHANSAATQSSLFVDTSRDVSLFLCDVQGISTQNTGRLGLSSTLVTKAVQASSEDFEMSASRMAGCTFLQIGRRVGMGQHAFLASAFDSCAPVGHWINNKHADPGGFEIQGAEIDNAISAGVLFRGGTPSIVRDCLIENSATDAVLANGPGKLLLDLVAGGGNTGAGVRALRGAQLEVVDAATIVTGTAGDLLVGVTADPGWAAFHAGVPISTVDAVTHFSSVFRDA